MQTPTELAWQVLIACVQCWDAPYDGQWTWILHLLGNTQSSGLPRNLPQLIFCLCCLLRIRIFLSAAPQLCAWRNFDPGTWTYQVSKFVCTPHAHTHTHSANVCSTFYAEIHEFLGAFCCNIIHLSFNCVNQWVIDSTHGGPLLHQRQKFAPNGYHGTERCQPVVLSAKLSTERAPSHCLP